MLNRKLRKNMGKSALTIRLSQDAIDRLEHMARLKLVSRHFLIEKILADKASTIDILPKLEQRPLPQSIFEAINTCIQRMKPGEETSLKKLVGNPIWTSLDDSVKRLLGKEFKKLVITGEIHCLTMGEKKSNNEQQYIKYVAG